MPSGPLRRLASAARELTAIATHDLKRNPSASGPGTSAAKERFIAWTGGSSANATKMRWVLGLLLANFAFVSVFMQATLLNEPDRDEWDYPTTDPTYIPTDSAPGAHGRHVDGAGGRVLDKRVLALPPEPRSPGTHRFAWTLPSGAPVSYDPCRPLFVVLHSPDAPRHAIPVVRDVLKSASAASGFALWPSQGGPVAAYPKDGRFGPYDRREATVHIEWTSSAHSVGEGRRLHSGLTTSSAAGYSEAERHYTGGTLPLDRRAFVKADGTPQERAVARGHVLHQVGHLLGLADVNDPAQVMHSKLGRGVDQYGAGDLTGLRTLSQGACHPDYP